MSAPGPGGAPRKQTIMAVTTYLVTHDGFLRIPADRTMIAPQTVKRVCGEWFRCGVVGRYDFTGPSDKLVGGCWLIIEPFGIPLAVIFAAEVKNGAIERGIVHHHLRLAVVLRINFLDTKLPDSFEFFLIARLAVPDMRPLGHTMYNAVLMAAEKAIEIAVAALSVGDPIPGLLKPKDLHLLDVVAYIEQLDHTSVSRFARCPAKGEPKGTITW